MPKTTKQNNSPDIQEQSMPAQATVSTIEKPSSSSTGESAVASAEDLVCPGCGAKHGSFQMDSVNGRVYCGQCGTNTDLYRKSPKWGPIIDAWKEKYGPAVPNLPEGTPTCKSKSYTRDKVEITCNTSSWQHDGKKLLFCGKCGSNYHGPQPENVKAIIEALGEQMSPPNKIPGPFTDAERTKFQKAANEGSEK